MCYSAQIWHDYRKYLRHFDAQLSLGDFIDLYWRRREEGASRVKIAEGLDAAFASLDESPSNDELKVARLIQEFDAGETIRLEQELFNK